MLTHSAFLRSTVVGTLASALVLTLARGASAQDGGVVPVEPGANPPAAAAPPPAAPPPAAPAATPPPGGEPAPAGAEPGTNAPPAGLGSEAQPGTNVGEADLKESTVGIRELPDHSYWFLGMRFRDFIVPKFMINIFVDGGATVNAFEFGPELTYRHGPLELDMHLGYADFSMDPFMFKEKSEPDRAFEKASSDMKLLVASIDIMANIPIDQAGRFSFLIGGDVGIAGVLGNLYRSQAYPAAYDPNNPQVVKGNPDDAGTWKECTGPDQPFPVVDDSGSSYCDASNNHYKGYSEKSMANGGDLPFVVPYLALPHIAFRAKPFADTQLRFDTGFSITGFFLGLGAGYRLPI